MHPIYLVLFLFYFIFSLVRLMYYWYLIMDCVVKISVDVMECFYGTFRLDPHGLEVKDGSLCTEVCDERRASWIIFIFVV